mmetsp:Transcript_4945/g.14119  ORF Transcript_4945/g.14119 Transcript_4945/m.14119 type:complete len:415 (-) Transcript_4945:683-1927(-)
MFMYSQLFRPRRTCLRGVTGLINRRVSSKLSSVDAGVLTYSQLFRTPGQGALPGMQGWDGLRTRTRILASPGWAHSPRWSHSGASNSRGRSDVWRRGKSRGGQGAARSRTSRTKKNPPNLKRGTIGLSGGSGSAAPLSRAAPPRFLFMSRFRSRLPTMYLPGGTHRLSDPGVLTSAAWRTPPFIVLFFLLVLSADADLHPYSPSPGRLQMCYGPSMMPTFAPYGDTVLRDSMSHRLPRRWKREWREGDVVVFVDYKGQLACKRIVAIGKAGGAVRVRRHGQFVEMFAEHKDWGIPDPTKVGSPAVPDLRLWDEENSAPNDGSCEEDMFRTIDVPNGSIWLEGDCPELSVDSRQYGPVPISRLRGRIVARLWPFEKRAEEVGKTILLSQERPKPVLVKELVQDDRYNLKIVERKV